MTITSAIQRGSFVYVYDEKNRQVGCYGGALHGYTGSSVSVKRGAFIYTYDEKGRQISANSAR